MLGFKQQNIVQLTFIAHDAYLRRLLADVWLVIVRNLNLLSESHEPKMRPGWISQISREYYDFPMFQITKLQGMMTIMW